MVPELSHLSRAQTGNMNGFKVSEMCWYNINDYRDNYQVVDVFQLKFSPQVYKK